MSRDINFNKSSMVKTSSSQHVERGQTKGIPQWVEKNASSSSPDSTVSFRVLSIVAQYEHHVQEEEDTDDVIENPNVEGQVQDSIAVHSPKGIYENWLGGGICTSSRGRG